MFRTAPGRPKGALGEKANVEKIARELHDIKQGGSVSQVTTYELLLRTMAGLAMSGDLRASRWLSEYFAKKNPEPDGSVGFLVAPEIMPPELFAAQMMLRNNFATNPELKDDPVTRPVAQPIKQSGESA